MRQEQKESTHSAACISAAIQIPTLDEYFELMQRLQFTTAQQAPTPQEDKEGNPDAGGVLFTGWTYYGYWQNGQLLRGKP